MAELQGYIASGLIAAAGAYSAVWAHLKFTAWRLDNHEKRIEKLEAKQV